MAAYYLSHILILIFAMILLFSVFSLVTRALKSKQLFKILEVINFISRIYSNNFILMNIQLFHVFCFVISFIILAFSCIYLVCFFV